LENGIDLSIVGSVKIFALTVLAWTGVIPTDDKMGSTEIFPDDGVPNSFSGTRHPHRQRQESQ